MDNDFKKIESLKEKVEKYRKILADGRSVISLINKYQNKFDKLSRQLGDKDGSLQKIANDARVISAALKQNHVDSASLLEQSKSIFKQIETLLVSKVDLENQISSTKSHLEEVDTDLNQKKSEISKILADIKALSELAHQKQDEIQVKLTKAISLEAEYETLIAKLNDPNDGIKSNIATSKQAKDEILAIKEEGKQLSTDIKLARDSALKSKEVVKTVEKESIDSKNKIHGYLEESKNDTKEIKNILALTGDYSLARAFKERKKALNLTLWIWALLLILAVSMVSWPLIRDYIDVSTVFSKEEWFALFLKFLVSAPLGLFAIFASRQYTSERLLQEKYAFKETVSRVYKAHVTFLIQNFPKKFDEIFDFTKNTVGETLTVPFDNKQTRIKFGLGSPFFGKFLNLSGEMEDVSTLASQFIDKDFIQKLALNSSTKTQEKTETTSKTTIDEK